MSPYSVPADDHRYRDNNKQWDDTNAESNAEIRSALMDSLQELRNIESGWHEDGFELQRKWTILDWNQTLPIPKAKLISPADIKGTHPSNM
ncbi:hypothetical protein QFC22_001855 [Naganishia vaughanmartiniae]|uniref:Uncharacterized protein n=1 Tax=Naganishia vaughanmartiniae TaxID=1424756 RepID=A0ACC2XGA7_9TREE|nr:hypothetical protein QFC22_001855 [Naganishia vaughanmartiniae]